MKKLKYLLTCTLVAAVALVSCESINEPDLPFDLDSTLGETGAFLRIIEIQSAALDFGNPNEANFSFVGEVGDAENGTLAETVNFYITYVTLDADFRPVPLEEVPLPNKTVTVSDLSVNEQSGLPRGTFQITLNEMLDAYGSDLNLADLELGGRFDIRWEIVMKDGRTFSIEDASQSVTGGFYNSPYFARANLVLSLPQDVFVGDYTITQDTASTDGVVAWAAQFAAGNPDGWMFNSQSSPQTFTTTLSVDPSNDLVGRVFDATFLEEWGYGSQTQAIEFGFYVTMSSPTAPGVGCGAGIAIGNVNGTVRGSFDPNDDSQFTFIVKENAFGDCGFPTNEVSFTAVKN